MSDKKHGKVITIKPDELETLKKPVTSVETDVEKINAEIHKKSDTTDQLAADKQPEELQQEQEDKEIAEGVTKKNATLRIESNLFSVAFTILLPATNSFNEHPTEKDILELYNTALTSTVHVEPTDIMLVKAMVRKM